MMKRKIRAIIQEAIATQEQLCKSAIDSIGKLTEMVISCLRAGGKVILFGNGGSAADSQHIAAELVGRFVQQRKGLAAIALTCNSSNLTAIGNDYSFEQIFTRQIEALGQDLDLALGITTSGSSANVLAGLAKAKQMGMKTAVLTSEKGKHLEKDVDLSICISSNNTARIQEAHITIGHIICELTEQAFL